MAEYLVVYSDELYHYGVLGMKWGVRRYQNSDGSLTSAGKKRYRASISSKTGKKYDFNKDATEKELEKHARSSLYTKSKILSSIALDHAASTIVQKVIEESSKESLAAVAGPAVTIAVKVAIESGERIANKVLTNSEKKKLDDLRKNESIDPETGLHLKSEDDASDDVMKVNPKYHDDSAGIGATYNCVRCTFAYDLRKRGYDVSAGLTLSGINGLYHTKKLYKNVVNVKVKSKPLSAYTDNGNTTLAHNMVNKLKTEPDSRGQLIVRWPFGGGHSMAYEVKNGRVNIIDAQRGTVYSNQDVLDVLCCCTTASYQRLDNLEINESRAKRYVI